MRLTLGISHWGGDGGCIEPKEGKLAVATIPRRAIVLLD
jgi:hypothetical protein